MLTDYDKEEISLIKLHVPNQKEKSKLKDYKQQSKLLRQIFLYDLEFYFRQTLLTETGTKFHGELK